MSRQYLKSWEWRTLEWLGGSKPQSAPASTTKGANELTEDEQSAGEEENLTCKISNKILEGELIQPLQRTI